MKTLKDTKRTFPFTKSLDKSESTENKKKLEKTNSRFGLYFKNTKDKESTSNSLLSQLYSEDNDTLFI